jgi:hypothetical protein
MIAALYVESGGCYFGLDDVDPWDISRDARGYSGKAPVVAHVALPELVWGAGKQRLHQGAVEKHGYEKARRIGVMAMIGGRDKTRIRNATPPAFRDVLLGIAQSARRCGT